MDKHQCWWHQSDFRFQKVGMLSQGLSHDALYNVLRPERANGELRSTHRRSAGHDQ